MKDLRLDIELANTNSSADTFIQTHVLTTENEKNMPKVCGDEQVFDGADGTYQYLGVDNVCSTKENSNGNTINCKRNTSGKENSGYLADITDTCPSKNINSVNSSTFEEQRFAYQIGAVTRNDSVIVTRFDKSKAKIKDGNFKINLLKTAFLLWNITNLGWDYGQMGPIFPDLQDIAGVSLSQGSWFFASFAVGYLFGCLASGFIQTKVNSHIMLFFYTMISAGSLTLLPWIPTFEVMVLLRGVNGIGIGGQDTCVHAMLFEIWGQKVGPYFQMLHVLYAVGGIISPLVTKPFLRDGKDTRTHIANTTSSSLQQISPSYLNSTVRFTDESVSTETHVHFALLISGVINTSAAIPFLVMFIRNGEKFIRQRNILAEGEQVETQGALPKRIEVVVLGIFVFIAFVGTAFLDLFPSFLTTFLMEQAKMTQQVGSSLTSAFFTLYAFGNFLMIFGPRYTTLTKIMIFSYASTIFLLTGVILSTIFPNETVLSALVSLCGLSMSVIIPTIYTWINEHVTPVTGKLTSALLVSGSLGIALNPLLAGYLMESYTPMWLIYLSLLKTIVCAVCFIAVLILTNKYSGNKKRHEFNDAVSDINRNEIVEGKVDIYLNGRLQNVYESTHM